MLFGKGNNSSRLADGPVHALRHRVLASLCVGTLGLPMCPSAGECFLRAVILADTQDAQIL